MTTTIVKKQVKEKIESAKASGKVFGVWFVKRSNGHLRHMSCRGGVTTGVVGSPKYNPDNYGLAVVYDMRNGFRSIPIDAIKQITIQGIRFTVEE